ncbi:hypothetical protein Salat_1904800 [Sesamum alatum]|uniref:Uncharacterized protein n=1 Tax=Sesamum alatum TaxID=300844 RepID=A0AAE1Y3R3_9LAMI|nr:hypothetical protein Salat_1904800 [Sesamum alatum]
MVRSMMIAKSIPKSFWPVAVNWAVHVINKSPTLAVQNKTPEEAWSGEKPSVGNFKVFEDGCWNLGEEFKTSIHSKLDWNENESDAEVNNDLVEEMEEEDDEEGSAQQEEARENQRPRRKHTQPF